MQIAPVSAAAPIVQTPRAAGAQPAPPASADATTQFVLDGPSGLIVQSYGALALISSAALALQAGAPRVLDAPPEHTAVAPVARIARLTHIDVYA